MKIAIEKGSVVFLDTLFGEGVRPTEDHALLALRLGYHDLFSWMLTTGLIPGSRLIHRVCLLGWFITGAEFTTCVERFFSLPENHTAFDRHERGALVSVLVKQGLRDRALSICSRYSSGNRKWGESLITTNMGSSHHLWEAIVNTDNADFVRDMLSSCFPSTEEAAIRLLMVPVRRDSAQAFKAAWAFCRTLSEGSASSFFSYFDSALASPKVFEYMIQHFDEHMPEDEANKVARTLEVPFYTPVIEMALGHFEYRSLRALTRLIGMKKLVMLPETVEKNIRIRSEPARKRAVTLIRLGWPLSLQCLFAACRYEKDRLYREIYERIGEDIGSEADIKAAITRELDFDFYGEGRETWKRRACALFGKVAVDVLGPVDERHQDDPTDDEAFGFEVESESEEEEGLAMEVEEEEL